MWSMSQGHSHWKVVCYLPMFLQSKSQDVLGDEQDVLGNAFDHDLL